jgi:hypothetical protein
MGLNQTESRVLIAESTFDDHESPYDHLEWKGAGLELGDALRMYRDLESEGIDIDVSEIQTELENGGVALSRGLSQDGDLASEFLEDEMFCCSEIYPEDEDWWSDDMEAGYADMPRIPTNVSIYINERDVFKVGKIGQVVSNWKTVTWRTKPEDFCMLWVDSVTGVTRITNMVNVLSVADMEVERPW